MAKESGEMRQNTMCLYFVDTHEVERTFKTAMSPTMLYGLDRWIIIKQHLKEMSLALMKNVETERGQHCRKGR